SNLNSTHFSNVSAPRSISLSHTTNTIIKSQQKNIHHERQQISSVCDDQDENLASAFGRSDSRLWLNRTCRITPSNSRELFNDDFKIDFDGRYTNQRKKRIIPGKVLCKFASCVFCSLLIIAGVVGIILYATNQPKNEATAQQSPCTIGAMTCSSPIFSWNKTGVCTQSAPSYRYFSCCHRAISTQLTIEFQLIEEVGPWHIDDVSIMQNNRELLINGGFESNLTGWIIISSANLSITPLAYSSVSAAHSGSAYLYSMAALTPDYIKQTVNVAQNQDVNVSFWWYDEGGVAGSTEKCEGYITLTP
ncbi:unnamed protein product, partial [Adineta ricciae]